MSATSGKSKTPRRTPKRTHGTARGSEQAAAGGTMAGMTRQFLMDTWEAGEWAFTAPQARTLDALFYGLSGFWSRTFQGFLDVTTALEALVELLATEGTISREALQAQFDIVLARNAVDNALNPAFKTMQADLQRLRRRGERERQKGA